MTARDRKLPDESHPISLEHNKSRIVIRLAGRIIADSVDALTLREANYPPVHYFPRKDVEMALFEPSSHSSYCPYKGEASYYSLPLGGERSVNAVWSYEDPYDAVAGIRGYVAFYPDRVDCIDEWESADASRTS